jgi:glycosyltransferase involved in cell wall biosynthesis
MRVLIVGDSPHINTGFGRVNSIAAKAFIDAGWSVAAVEGLNDTPPTDDKGIKTYTGDGLHKGDPLGFNLIPKAFEEFKPDAVYMTADTGSVAMFAQVLPDIPSFNYQPIEGSPITNIHWKRVVTQLPFMTCSKFGQDLMKQQFRMDIDYAYHGVDHDVFKVNGSRDDVRKALGWSDKFVIMACSTNVRRKQLPRLIEAFSLVRNRFRQKDAILYLHTVPFQNHWLEGWNLMDVARMFGVEDSVFFNPNMSGFGKSVPLTTDNPNNPGLVELYNAADLLVNPSQVEGFGLPPAEAMACGLPVLVTKYAAGWEIVSPAGRGIPVHDWEVHKSGTLYANVSPAVLAQEILRLKRAPKERQRMSEAGLARAQDFQWKHFTDKLIPAMEKAVVTHQERSVVKQAQDSPEGSPGK